MYGGCVLSPHGLLWDLIHLQHFLLDYRGVLPTCTVLVETVVYYADNECSPFLTQEA